MSKQRGLDVLEFECLILESLNKRDKMDILIEKEVGLNSTDIIESIEATMNSIISNRDEKLSRYRKRLKQLSLDNDRNSGILSEDALEFLYQEFLQEHLRSILLDIERFYERNVQSLLEGGVVHFERSAQKIAKHNLYTYAVGYIVTEHLYKQRVEQFAQVCSLIESRHLKSSGLGDIKYILSEKYTYFESRLSCCLDIGNAINNL